MPRPPTMRAATSAPGVETEADHSAATKNSAAPTMSTGRRPKRSETKPEKPTPTTPPIMIEDTIRPSMPVDRCHSAVR